MKKYISILLLVFSINIYSKPFISISEIDYNTAFPKITVNVTVKSADGMPMYGLTEDNLILYENDYRVNYVKVQNTSTVNNEVIYFVFSIDSSKSISEEFLDTIKKSITEIIAVSGKNEKIAVIRFNDEVILLNNFTNIKQQLLQNLKSIKRHGKKTMLYNSIFDSIDLLKDTSGSSKSVIIFTDGKDEGSTVTAEDIVNHAKENNVPLYFMCLKDSKNRLKLARISKLTGGKLIYGNDATSLPSMYSGILQDLRSRYTISYNSQLKKNGKRHKIEVRLKYGSIRDRDKAYFTAPSYLNLDLSKIDFNKDTFLLLIIILLSALVIIVSLKLHSIKKSISTERINIREVNTSSNETEQYPMDNNDKYLVQLVEQENAEYEKYEKNELPEKNNYYTAWLVQKSGPKLGEKFPIYWEELTLGRGRENTITVNDDSLSDKHIMIKNVGKTYMLFDMATDSGTYLNNKKLLRPKELYDWDEIRIGRTMFVFRGSKVK